MNNSSVGQELGLSVPWGGFAYHDVTLWNLTASKELANTIPFSLNELKTSVDSFANEVMDKIIALDYLLAEGRSVCVLTLSAAYGSRKADKQNRI